MSVEWNDLNFERTVRDFEYTRRAVSRMNDVVYSAEFEDMDADAIFTYLYEDMELVSFKDYLKRYLYMKADIKIPFPRVSDEVYKNIITGSFRENAAPHSFEPTTRKWGATVKGWLSQENVRRPVVFLLGFGLRMSPEDVNEFLTKVLKEEGIRYDDARELIFWYCYKNGLRYARAREYLDRYEKLETGPCGTENEPWERREPEIANEDELFDYLIRIRKKAGPGYYEQIRYAELEKLVQKVKELITALYAEDARETGKVQEWTADRITSADIEKVICSGIPLTKSGNLEKMSASLLNRHFRQKRITRQRLDELADHHLQVDRFDLITLYFYIISRTMEDDEPEARSKVFIDGINIILERCGLSELYPVNPYETFILMCLLSETPMENYAQIWEMSYEQ